MILTIQEILSLADKQGLSEKDICDISGRKRITVWRWRTGRVLSFDFDEGMRKLIERVNEPVL